MPVSGSYNWYDKRDQIIVEIPLKGVSPSKVDILATSSTLKVNYSPYLIDIILSHSIDEHRHKARVKDGILILTLFKVISEVWETLELDKDNEEKERIKNQALLKHQELEQDLEIKRKDKRIADEKFSTRSQMNLEEKERTRLETKKEEEKKVAEEELYSTFAKMQNEQQQKQQKEKEKVNIEKKSQKNVHFNQSQEIQQSFEDLSDNDDNDNNDNHIDQEDIDNKIQEKEIQDYKNFIQNSNSLNNQNQNQDDNNDNDDDIKYIPPPRHTIQNQSSIPITFTPRIFPTPMRESKLAEEEEWVMKNRKYLKKHGQLGHAVPRGTNGQDITENDPVWLKGKGDDYYRDTNYLSAINAYSSAIEFDSDYLECYLNRSLCYLKLLYNKECIQDCEDGINIIEKRLSIEKDGEVEISKRNLTNDEIKLYLSKNKLLFRKGISYCQVGNFKSAIESYEEGYKVMKLLENNNNNNQIELNFQSVENDIQKLRQLHESSEYKALGDKLFGEKNLTEALIQYNKAIEIIPQYISCISNRSACKIALNDFNSCIIDCSLILELLDLTNSTLLSQQNGQKMIATIGKDSLNMLTAIIPPVGSDKRKEWYLKTLVRRGVAYVQLEKYDEAIVDYNLACSLDPTNVTLKNDLANLTNHRSKVVRN